MRVSFYSAPVVALFSVSILTGCGGGGGGGGASDSTTPQTTETYTIKANGGQGGSNGGTGGLGGEIYFEQYGGGDLSVLSAPSIVSSAYSRSFTYSLQSIPAADLGSTPLEVTSDLTVNVESIEPAAGTYYMVNSVSAIYQSDGDGILGNADIDEEQITGIHISENITLTLGLNYATLAQLNLSNDFHNQGTVTTQDSTNGHRGYLFIYPSNFINEGNISLSAHTEGQNGGSFKADTNDSIFNHGPITTSGIDSSSNLLSSAGTIDLVAVSYLQNTAPITATGGNTSSMTAGNGGSILFQTSNGDIINTGAINNTAGSGESSGDPDYISLLCLYACNVVNTGDITANGGNATSDSSGGGVEITIRSRAGHIIATGDIISRGGNTTHPSSNGGSGGRIYIEALQNPSDLTQPVGNIELSGNINVSGGNTANIGSGNGGAGGVLQVTLNNRITSTDQHIKFSSYESININGGDGNYGGAGGQTTVLNKNGDAPAGNIYFEPDLFANGGDADEAVTGTTGGNGGTIAISSQSGASTQSGAATYAGGNGKTSGNEGSLSVDGVCVGTCI